MKYRIVKTGASKYRIQVKLTEIENGFIAVTSNWTATWNYVSDVYYHTKEDAEDDMFEMIEKARLAKLKDTIVETYPEIEV